MNSFNYTKSNYTSTNNFWMNINLNILILCKQNPLIFVLNGIKLSFRKFKNKSNCVGQKHYSEKNITGEITFNIKLVKKLNY